MKESVKLFKIANITNCNDPTFFKDFVTGPFKINSKPQISYQNSQNMLSAQRNPKN